MPGSFKLTNFTTFSIFHPHKPYKLLNTLSSSSSATISTAVPNVESGAILRLKPSAARWRTKPVCVSATHPKISSQIFGGSKAYFFVSDSEKKRRDCRYDRPLKTSFDTQMRAYVNGKVDNQYQESDVSPPPEHDGEKKGPKLLTLPTVLTVGRVAAVPLLVSTFHVESWWGPTATTGIFILAAITDWLDGYLARKMNLGTQFGAFLDPVADKLMVAATLILLCTKPIDAGMFGQAPWLLTIPAIAIIGREITMSAVREWAASQDKKLLEAVAVNNLGKWKTATQMSALTILLATRDGSLVGAGSLVSFGITLLYISAWLALWSLIVYMRKIWKVLLR